MRDGVQNHLDWPKVDLCSKGVGNSGAEKVGLRKFCRGSCAPQSSISGERLLGIRSTATSCGRRRRVSEAENKIICIGSHPHKSKRYICRILWDGTRDRYSVLDQGVLFPLPLDSVSLLGTYDKTKDSFAVFVCLTDLICSFQWELPHCILKLQNSVLQSLIHAPVVRPHSPNLVSKTRRTNPGPSNGLFPWTYPSLSETGDSESI